MNLQLNKLEKKHSEKKRSDNIDIILPANNILNNDKEYKNIIYYPTSTKEWLNSVYTYNKLHIKSFINTDLLIYNLLKNYFNMFEYKMKELHRTKIKRRRTRKNRLSANKIFISKAEIKHTNLKVIVILYIFNKQKLLIERYMRKIVKFIKFLHTKRDIKHYRSNFYKSFFPLRKNRIMYNLKKRYLFFKKWNIIFINLYGNVLEDLFINIKKINTKNTYSNKVSRYYIKWLKKLSKLEEIFFENVKLLNFNLLKFSNFMLNFNDLGLVSLINKIYNKKVEIKVIELRSIHLNSDVFSSAVALKLRDRKNKAARILRKAILKMVKIPDFHSLLTSDDFIEDANKYNILNVLKQQVVSGVRFEASGRLTRRLTAMRSVFKYRYIGGLKNIRSSYNNKASTMLRGYSKSNLQYTNINSKTRNGTFGLKGWVSSH